ncbi:MAG: ADP-ribosylglycohydrolase family protein [Muribaculaceae bacterium]|nr:ADP-ribosylglycohydrolase family protein [Muribaculaceae bacterium]
MLGAIIGDIVGSRYEFNPTNDYNFEMFGPGSDFTDDTVCTIAVADALLKGRCFGANIHEWCRKYPHPKGEYGGRFYQWVMSNNPVPYGSFGNGSAMRVSPIGWWYTNPADVLKYAAMTAECTHNHSEGIKGACTVALAIYMAKKMKLESGEVDVPVLLQECVKYSGYNININKSAVINRFDETCQGTVPVALWIIGESNSFEDAIRRAVSLGADADTLGAIVGGIAEVIWSIPEWMKQKAIEYLPAEMKVVLSSFRKIDTL